MSPRSIRGALALGAAAIALPMAAAAEGNAPTQSAPTAAAERVALTPRDLVGLRDIGPVSPDNRFHIFSLSPDRQRIAFQERRALPETNGYRLTMFVQATKPRATPIVVDQGGEFIRQTIAGVGGVAMSTGLAKTITPQWSPDGKAIYFLKRVAGITRVWSAATNGSDSAPVTRGDMDIDDFALSIDGKRLIYAVRETDSKVVMALTHEASRGYRYDKRFVPLFSKRPIAAELTHRAIFTMDLSSHAQMIAQQKDAALLAGQSRPSSSMQEAFSQSGRRAWTVQQGETLLGAPSRLYAESDTGRTLECAHSSCTGAGPIWWASDDRRIRYIRREGWGDSQTAVYEWAPGTSEPRRLLTTDDLLIDCQPLGEKILCAREQSAVPRQLIRLDPQTARAEMIYNPNPEFSRYTLGAVERLRWRNTFGIETFGDLIYPVGYIAGRRYPLVVVQYGSRGFLRGGTGDEFPIQAFANRGYAVLSVQRPAVTPLADDPKDSVDMERQLLLGFKDRRSVLSSIESEVHALIDRGIVDPDRVGITGLSDGSSTVQFTTINSKLFKAASATGCCWEPWQDAVVGPAVAEAYHKIGWPPLVSGNTEFWRPMSLVQNATRIDVPLLIQQSDEEFGGAIASYTALQQAGKPVSLFIFPDEHHVKWQPEHRLAVYERNIRWFDYWLRGIGDPSEWGVTRNDRVGAKSPHH